SELLDRDVPLDRRPDPRRQGDELRQRPADCRFGRLGLEHIAFSLLYWELDGVGSAQRTHSWPSRRVDLAFPQDLNPHVAHDLWLPRFIDYLYLGLTNATASARPTGCRSPRAKIAMGLQSMISLAILGLVVARAVNVFT